MNYRQLHNTFWLLSLGGQETLSWRTKSKGDQTGGWDQASRLQKERTHQTSCIKDQEDGNKPAPGWKQVNCTSGENWCRADGSRWTDGICQSVIFFFRFCGRIKKKKILVFRSTEAEYENSKTEWQIKTDFFFFFYNQINFLQNKYL